MEAAWDHAALARTAALRVERAVAEEPRRSATARGWVWTRPWFGRPGSLAVRVLVAAVPLLAQLVTPGGPAVPGLAAGTATWLAVIGRSDLAPIPRR